MSKENGGSAAPVFDFGRVSRRWTMNYIDSQARVTEIQQEMQAQDDETAAVKLFREMQACVEEQNTLIAQVLVSVPDAWKTADAPDDFDASNPEHLLDYIRNDAPLHQSLQQARQADSKN